MDSLNINIMSLMSSKRELTVFTSIGGLLSRGGVEVDCLYISGRSLMSSKRELTVFTSIGGL